MSSTSEHLPRPEPTKGHQHVWEHTGQHQEHQGITLSVYGCRYCGDRLSRGTHVR